MSSADLTRLDASALAEKLASGDVSSVEATQAHLDRIAAVDADIHAFLHLNAAALDTAAAIDAQRAAGEKLAPLAGVPVAIKDVLCTLDMPSTAGSKILEGWVPPYDATPVAKLRAAEPPPEPPGMRSRSHGLCVAPYAECSVDEPIANSSMLVLPSGTSPAARIRATTVAS